MPAGCRSRADPPAQRGSDLFGELFHAPFTIRWGPTPHTDEETVNSRLNVAVQLCGDLLWGTAKWASIPGIQLNRGTELDPDTRGIPPSAFCFRPDGRDASPDLVRRQVGGWATTYRKPT